MANLDPDKQDEDIEEWLDKIKPIIEMNRDFERQRQEQQSQINSEDEK